MKNRKIVFLAIFLAISAVYVISPKSQVVSIQGPSLIIPILAVLIGVYASKIYGLKSANGRALLLVTGGLACLSVGEIILYLSGNFISSVSLDSSIASVFFLLAYPFFGASIYQGYVTAGIKLKTVNKSLLYVVSLASIILTIFVAYFGVYRAYNPSANLLTNAINIGYGVGDLILVIASLFTILLASEYRGGKLAVFWKSIALGFFVTLMADVLFAVYGDQVLAGVKPYLYIDLIWTAGYMFLAFAITENYLYVSAVQKNIKLKLLQRS